MSVPPDSTVPPPAAPPPADGPIHESAPSAAERQWALFAHLSALLGCLLTGHWFGWGCFIGPLIIWLIKKDTMPFVDDQGKEALNFNITLALIGVILLLFSIITFGLGFIPAFFIGGIVGIAWLVLIIIAAVKANEGVRYRYPFALRLVK